MCAPFRELAGQVSELVGVAVVVVVLCVVVPEGSVTETVFLTRRIVSVSMVD